MKLFYQLGDFSDIIEIRAQSTVRILLMTIGSRHDIMDQPLGVVKNDNVILRLSARLESVLADREHVKIIYLPVQAHRNDQTYARPLFVPASLEDDSGFAVTPSSQLNFGEEVPLNWAAQDLE